jgi:Ca2+/H+ antiporter, TMEM165/GDT1 family
MVEGKFDEEDAQSLWMSFLVIMVSEIGDKTFLIAAVMAMSNPRILIFSAAMSALFIMTVLSAAFGHFVPTLISKTYTQFLAALLFLVFGIKMLYDSFQMTGNEGQEELEEVTNELIHKEDDEKTDELEKGGVAEKTEKDRKCAGLNNLANLFFSAVFIQTFVLTFLVCTVSFF